MRIRRLTAAGVTGVTALAVAPLLGCGHAGIDSYKTYREQCQLTGSRTGDCADVFEIRTRDPHRLSNRDLSRAYPEEYAYLWSRRGQPAATSDPSPVTSPRGRAREVSAEVPPPPNLIGLALSGGGIRSASFDLGVLQALEKSSLYDQVDYLSAVSGGGYLASWIQAHLGARQYFQRDVYNFPVAAPDAESLLEDDGAHVEHLRTHTGFINTGHWFEAARLAGAWLWRWPFHLVIDDLFHVRGRYNFHHLGAIYRERIELSYFRGEADGKRAIRDTPLTDLNPASQAGLAPYLILNGNLTNVGPSQIKVKHRGPPGRKWLQAIVSPEPDHWNFEFTRDFVGSDGTGYLSTPGFARPVTRVLRDRKIPAAAVVEPGRPWPETKPFRLSEASMASGAAVDAAAFLSRIDVPVAAEFEQLLAGGVLNAYLGPEVPNFARAQEGWAGPVGGYLAMFTFQRVPRWVGTGARWLEITDGGHYDNLGVTALLRRGARCIVAVDASEDRDRDFESLRQARSEAENAMDLYFQAGFPEKGDPRAHIRLEVRDGEHQLRAVVLYVKSTGDQQSPHLQSRKGFSAERARRSITALRAEHVARVTALLRAIDRSGDGAQLQTVERLHEVVQPPSDCAAKRDALEGLRDARDALQKDIANDEEAVAKAREHLAATDPNSVAKQAEDDRLYLKQQQGLDPNEVESLEQEITQRVKDEQARILEHSDPVAIAADEKKVAEAAARQAELQQLDYAIATSTAELDVTSRVQAAENELLRTRRALWTSEKANRERASFEHDERQYLALWLRLARDYACNAPEEADAARDERIEKILAFSDGPQGHAGFPHDSTGNQTYTWERFEAYRLLGYQTASTFLDRLRRPEGDDRDGAEPDLGWCRFADAPASESGD